MRKGFLAASFIVILSLFLCSVASAATEAKAVCSGTQLVPSPVRITDQASFSSAVNGFMGTTNLCTNEVIKLNISIATLSGGLTDQITCICPNQAALQKVGCDKGQQQPTVTFDLSAHGGDCAKDTFTISKCVKNPEAAFKSVCTSGQSMAYVQPSSQPSAPVSGPSAPPPQNAGTQALAQTLSNFGVSAAQAQQLAQSNPNAANSLVQAFESQDPTQIQNAANAAGVQLNPSTISNAVALTPDQVQQAAAPLSGNTSGSPDTTGFDQNGTASANIAQSLAGMCNQQGMGGCGSACNVPNPSQLTCGANNPGALTYSSWQSAYGGYACGLSNNTTCFQTVEGGIAAQAHLLTTNSNYFGSGNNTILGAFCGGYTATGNCSEYASFISAQTGIPLNQTIDPNNAQQIGAIMMASSRFENGKGVIYTPDQLQSGLQVAYGGGQLPVGTPGFVPTYIAGNDNTQYTSPFNITGDGSNPAPAATMGSPFANVTPAPYSQALQAASTPAPQVTTITPAPVVSPSVVTILASSTVPAAVQAVATFLAQPSSVSRGASFLLTWATVGMQSGSCVVSMGSTTLVNLEQGYLSLSTSSTTPTSLIFSLDCLALSGDSVSRSATVSVH